MSYRRYLVHAFISLTSLIGVILDRVCRIALAPFVVLLRETPASAEFAILPRIKAIYFTVIGLLKPEYRESYDTNGLSLTSLRC